MNFLLSHEALIWLRSVNFIDRSHEERVELIKVAKTLFPNDVFPSEEEV